MVMIYNFKLSKADSNRVCRYDYVPLGGRITQDHKSSRRGKFGYFRTNFKAAFIVKKVPLSPPQREPLWLNPVSESPQILASCTGKRLEPELEH